MGKGSQNERDKCQEWSLWWTGGRREDVFWRTSGSGARARSRVGRGKNVLHGYGDLMAEDPEGEALPACCTFEFKKGYPSLSLLDCIASRQAEPLLISFLKQVERDSEDAGTWPVLVLHKDRRLPVVCIPDSMYLELSSYCGKFHGTFLVFNSKRVVYKYILMRQQDFFDWASPSFFIQLYHSRRRRLS